MTSRFLVVPAVAAHTDTDGALLRRSRAVLARSGGPPSGGDLRQFYELVPCCRHGAKGNGASDPPPSSPSRPLLWHRHNAAPLVTRRHSHSLGLPGVCMLCRCQPARCGDWDRLHRQKTMMVRSAQTENNDGQVGTDRKRRWSGRHRHEKRWSGRHRQKTMMVRSAQTENNDGQVDTDRKQRWSSRHRQKTMMVRSAQTENNDGQVGTDRKRRWSGRHRVQTDKAASVKRGLTPD